LAQWAQLGFILSILTLGLGVFLWGTAYKMSLYESSPIHNKVPVAKLSTQSSSENKDEAASVIVPHEQAVFPLLLDLAFFILALSMRPCLSHAENANKPQRFTSFYFYPVLFFRPPPFSFHG
jgi:hypothetical protein